MSDTKITAALPPVVSTGLSALVQAQAQTSPPVSLKNSAEVKVNAGDKASSSQEQVSLLDKAAATIGKYIPHQPPGTQLRIEKDKSTNLFVYQAVNPKNGEVVSQYPSEQIVKFISYFREKEGLAVDKSA